MEPCKAYMIIPGSGPLIILTSYNSVTDAGLVAKLNDKGIEKFIAFELPVNVVRKRYGAHFDAVLQNLEETDDLRVLDFDGPHAFRSFDFAEMGQPIFVEKSEVR